MRLHPIRALGLISKFAVILTLLGACGHHSSAQDTAGPDAKAGEQAEQLEEMKEVMRSFKVVAIDDQGKETPAALAEEPAHRWTDPTRAFSGGALWVWRASGRPVAVIGMERYGSWSLEFVSVTAGRVRAGDGSVRWAPRHGVEFREIPDAPAPAAGEAQRLRQIRDLAKRFSAREHWKGGDGQHYALRQLTHPIDRYSDPASGVVDGAIFVYAYGTNPEALLVIEARRQGSDPPRWSFAAVPFSHCEITLDFGSKNVWKCLDKAAGRSAGPNDLYYDVLVPPRRSTVGGPIRLKNG